MIPNYQLIIITVLYFAMLVFTFRQLFITRIFESKIVGMVFFTFDLSVFAFLITGCILHFVDRTKLTLDQFETI